MDLWAAYEGDYFLGATDHCEGAFRRYWPCWHDVEDLQIVRLESVPTDTARKLCVHNTRQQCYGDGYEAAQAAAPYVSAD